MSRGGRASQLSQGERGRQKVRNCSSCGLDSECPAREATLVSNEIHGGQQRWLAAHQQASPAVPQTLVNEIRQHAHQQRDRGDSQGVAGPRQVAGCVLIHKEMVCAQGYQL
ncbi:MAG: hypothetical protein C5B50_21830 [Verrucomicrobia bacterium]|nr:MAG: hypothetical protein C5B50_21830 [Verrucomicrobiota bacterium]